MAVGSRPTKQGEASVNIPMTPGVRKAAEDGSNRIQMANRASSRPIQSKAAPPTPKSLPQSYVAPAGFTVELIEPPSAGEDEGVVPATGEMNDQEQARPAASFQDQLQDDGNFQDERLQDDKFQDDEVPPPAPPPRRTPPSRTPASGTSQRSQLNQGEDYGIDRAERDSNANPKQPPRYTPDPKVRNCAEVYNDRDCCEEGEFCADQSRRVRSRALRTYSKASLDITPRYQPDPNADETAGQYADRLARSMAKLESRDWRDRNGNVVANGKLVDFKNGRVVIESAQGTQELLYLALANNDQCFVNAWWDLPNECAIGDDVFQTRQWASSTFAWKASGLCHKPLYWEDVNLERYGHTVGPVAQPFVSGAHFFGTIFVLPYKMGINPPGECQYDLGYYRPGSCAPRYISPLPLSRRGAMLQATSVLGLIWLTP